MKKMIPALVAIVLIFIIIAASLGMKLIEKYSYSKERADLEEYFELENEDTLKVNIENAIKKASGTGAGENWEEIRYEGYGPNGIAIIVEALTDNKNRTASSVRSTFSKYGGNMGETGSVSFMFDKVGIIAYEGKVATEEVMLEAGIEAGADNVESSEEWHEITTSVEDFIKVRDALIEKFGEPKEASLKWVAKDPVVVDDLEKAEKINKLIEVLEDNDDVQNVYSNFEVADEIADKL